MPEVTLNLAKVENGKLYVRTLYGMTPAYPYPSIEGLFFNPKGETVTFEENELSVENCRGIKWEDPVIELRVLTEKDPKHRLQYKGSLNEIATNLQELGRKQEAREVQAVKRKLHSVKKCDFVLPQQHGTRQFLNN